MKKILLILIILLSNINAGENVTPNNDGRYVFESFGSNVHVLDTKTGRLWILIEIKHGDRENEIFLKPIPYLKHLKLKNADMFKIMPESKE